MLHVNELSLNKYCIAFTKAILTCVTDCFIYLKILSADKHGTIKALQTEQKEFLYFPPNTEKFLAC